MFLPRAHAPCAARPHRLPIRHLEPPEINWREKSRGRFSSPPPWRYYPCPLAYFIGGEFAPVAARPVAEAAGFYRPKLCDSAMNILSRFNKPEYFYRPVQILNALRANHFTHRAEATVTLPWGLDLAVNPGEAIGR